MSIDEASEESLRTRNAGNIGITLFLAALAMLFASSLLGYLVIRGQIQQSNHPPAITLPMGFWISTLFLLAGSFAIHRAVRAVKGGDQAAFRRGLVVTLLAAGAFLVVQTPCLLWLLEAHKAVRPQGVYLYGMVFFLVLLHALHVVGGLISLARVAVRGFRGDFDEHHSSAVKFTALYWHFLDIVWIAMFAVLAIAG